MFGMFGLGPKPTNFSDFNDPQPSYMWSLKNQSIIPSLSYGYTAGASYNSSLASLVLGGYDASQINVSKKEDVQFNMDLSFNLGVGLQEILGTDTLTGTTSLLPEGIMTYIDSTIPEIWLPIPACEMFESAFGKKCILLASLQTQTLFNLTTHKYED